MKKTLAITLLSAFAISAAAETLPFTYNFDGAEPTGYRKFKSKPDHDTETIDVAIFIDGSMAGKKVTSISVPVMGDLSVLKDLSAFMTTKLATRNQGALKFNNPDICSVEATLDGNVLKATFAEPYTITEKGVYVGYSVTDTSMEAKPVAVVSGDADDSFWYRGSEANAKWADLGKTQSLSSAMTVYLDGIFDAYNVALDDIEDSFVAVGETAYVPAEFATFGTDPVRSLDYTVTVNGKTESYTLNLDSEIPAILGKPFALSLAIPAVDALGEYDLSITVDKVNGQQNVSVYRTETAKIDVIPFVPKNNPLVEEYTGLNCGWCPRGYVILKQMHDKYGIENFVAIAYHTMMESGCMVHLDEIPWYPEGLPAAQVNRTETSGGVSGIPAVWESRRKSCAPGEVEVKLDWADEAKTEMIATAKARFLENDDESPYLLSFCVVADGLSNPAWKQSNAYGNPDTDTSGCTGDYWDLFVGKSNPVTGIVYDDVAVLYPDQQGAAGSLPAQINASQWYETTFRFKPAEITNERGEVIISDYQKLRVIAIINDTESGKVVNSASSLYVDGTGAVGAIESAGDDAPVYYDLTGRRVSRPERGIYIRLQNGRATKVAF